MKTRAVVDRLEGDVAVLLIGDGEKRVDFPAEYLPSVHEGSVLTLQIEVDESDEAARRQKTMQLIERLVQRGRKSQ